MFVGLVQDPRPDRWSPDDDERPDPSWPTLPWRPFAWFAAFCWLLFAAGEIGGLAGYLLLLFAIALGCWRLDRWLDKHYWGGLTER